MLQTAGTDNLAPWMFQADSMNGTGPSPQPTLAENSLFTYRAICWHTSIYRDNHGDHRLRIRRTDNRFRHLLTAWLKDPWSPWAWAGV
jgi:hypothetical protein